MCDIHIVCNICEHSGPCYFELFAFLIQNNFLNLFLLHYSNFQVHTFCRFSRSSDQLDDSLILTLLHFDVTNIERNIS